MNCKEAHLLIAGLNGEVLPAALATHAEACRDCADLLAVDARLRATLRSHHPAASPYVLGRIRQEIAAPPRRSWPESLKKNPLMKITLPALTALAVATVLISLPHSAVAATPLATFAKMKKAVLAHAKTLTPMEIHIGKNDDGSVGTWVIVDGELIQPDEDGTFHVHKEGADVTIQQSTVTDLSSLPPKERAEVQKAIDEAISGGGNSSHTRVIKKYLGPDGKEIDEATAQAAMRAQGIEITTSIDLDEDDYRTVAFGTDHDHLVLTRKKAKDQRTVVTLDPKTSLPKTVLLERNVGGKWIAAKRSNVKLR